MIFSASFLLVGLAAAYPPLRSSKRGTMSGIATFNSYRNQGSTVCGPLAGTGLMDMNSICSLAYCTCNTLHSLTSSCMQVLMALTVQPPLIFRQTYRAANVPAALICQSVLARVRWQATRAQAVQKVIAASASRSPIRVALVGPPSAVKAKVSLFKSLIAAHQHTRRIIARPMFRPAKGARTTAQTLWTLMKPHTQL